MEDRYGRNVYVRTPKLDELVGEIALLDALLGSAVVPLTLVLELSPISGSGSATFPEQPKEFPLITVPLKLGQLNPVISKLPSTVPRAPNPSITEVFVFRAIIKWDPIEVRLGKFNFVKFL